MYLAAITEVNARKLVITPHMMKLKGIDYSSIFGTSQPERIKQYLRTFHEPILELVIPPIREKCVNVRTVLFGDPFRKTLAESWVVNLMPDRNAGDNGHIDLIRTVEFPLKSGIPKSNSPYPTPLNFSLCQRINPRFTLHWDGSFQLAKPSNGYTLCFTPRSSPTLPEASTLRDYL